MGDRPYLMLQWHDPETGKRKSKSAGTCNPLDAEKARADLEYELNHGLYQDAGRMSWESFRETFEREYAAPLRAKTRENYDATFDLFERLCNPRRLDLLTARTLSAFAAGMRSATVYGGKKGYAPGTVKLYLQFLHTALAWAVEQGLLTKVPAFPEARAPERVPQPVPAESFEKLLDKAPDHETHVFLLTGWLAGLRLAEVFRLEWDPTDKAPYLDLARDRIVIPAAVAKNKRDQWVPLDPVLREALLSLPRTGARVFRLPGYRGPMTLRGMSQRVRNLAKKAGVRMSMHTLRKGFGCRHAGRVPAQVLQKLMRHGNIKTTMTYYCNVDDAVMEAILGPRSPENGIRNTSRNSEAPQPPANGGPEDATPYPDESF
jgi:integrase